MRFSENGCTKILAFQQCKDVAEILNGITSVRQFLQLPSFWNLKSSENDIIFLRQITSSFFNDFNFPLTRVSRSRFFTKRLSQKRCILETKLLYDANRKQLTGCRMVAFSMTLSDLWPGFQSHDIFQSRNYSKRCILYCLTADKLIYLNSSITCRWRAVPRR